MLNGRPQPASKVDALSEEVSFAISIHRLVLCMSCVKPKLQNLELIERAEAFYSSELLTSASRSSARGRTLWFRAACSRTLKGQVSCFLRVLTSPGSEARKTKRLQRWRKSHVASCIAFVHFLAYNDKHKPRSGNQSRQLFLLIHCFRLALNPAWSVATEVQVARDSVAA